MAANSTLEAYSPLVRDTRNGAFIQQTLQTVIDKGMPLMTNDLSDSLFTTWVDFTKEMLRIATKDEATSIYLNYLQLLLTLHSTKLTPYQKLYHCLQYLLEITKVVLG